MVTNAMAQYKSKLSNCGIKDLLTASLGIIELYYSAVKLSVDSLNLIAVDIPKGFYMIVAWSQVPILG